MEITEILERFALLAELTQEQAQVWRGLCEDAMIRIQSQCRMEPETAEQSGLLCAAVSALAFYWYALRRDAAAGESFSAGDVKFSAGSSAAAAKELWINAREAAASLLRDDGFFFGTVPQRGNDHDPQ